MSADLVAEPTRRSRGPAGAIHPGRSDAGPGVPAVAGATPIAELVWRTRTRVAGRVKSLRVQPWAQAHSLECVLVDGSGHAVTLVFLGRRSVSGVRSGSLLIAEGMVGKHRNKLAIINPSYELLSATEGSDAS